MPEWQVYDELQPVFFVHIPKTAGSSLRVVLASWFAGKLYEHQFQQTGALPLRHDVGAGDCVVGHFNSKREWGLLQYYPSARQYFTMIRNPFDRFVSQWLVEEGRIGASFPRFPDWLEIRRRTAKMYVGAYLPWPPLGDDLSFAFRANCLAVGLTDRFDDLVRVFASVLGKHPPATFPRANVTGRPADEFEHLREPCRQAFPQDYAIYDHAVLEFESLAQRYL